MTAQPKHHREKWDLLKSLATNPIPRKELMLALGMSDLRPFNALVRQMHNAGHDIWVIRKADGYFVWYRGNKEVKQSKVKTAVLLLRNDWYLANELDAYVESSNISSVLSVIRKNYPLRTRKRKGKHTEYTLLPK